MEEGNQEIKDEALISDDKRMIQNREMCRNDERNKRRVFIDKGRRLKERRGKLIVASPDPYCFQRIFLRIQYKTIRLLLTGDVLHTVWTDEELTSGSPAGWGETRRKIEF